MQVETNQGTKLYGFYRGIVVKHLDHGCCKVFIPGVYPDSLSDNPDNLPTAEQITPLLGGSLNGNGVFSYPNLGSTVVCGFWNGDQNFPLFWGSTLGGPLAKQKYVDARPNVNEKTLSSGQDAFNHIISVDKSKIEINEAGYIDVITKDDYDLSNFVHIVLDGKGNLIIDTTQQVQVHSPNILLSADQSFEIDSPQVLINAKQSYELNTKTLKENVQTNTDRTAQDISFIGSNTINLESPTIILDSSTGSTTIKGPKHSSFFS